MNENKLVSAVESGFRAAGDVLAARRTQDLPSGRAADDAPVDGAQDAQAGSRSDSAAPGLPGLNEQWRRVRARLHAELGEATFNSWFRQIDLIGVGDGRVVLAVPTRFIRNWLMSHYAERLSALWREEDPALARLEVLVRARGDGAQTDGAMTGGAMAGKTAGESVPEVSSRSAPRPAPKSPSQSSPLLSAQIHTAQTSAAQSSAVGPGGWVRGLRGCGGGAPLDPRFTFEAFVVGKSNELAHAAARRVAEATMHLQSAVSFCCVGLGKTHLRMRSPVDPRPPAGVRYFISRPRSSCTVRAGAALHGHHGLQQQFRTVDVLMIVTCSSSPARTDAGGFFHPSTPDNHNRQVIISADRSPSDLEGIEERIRSRLGWGLAADIHPTDYELRLGILQAKAEEMIQRNGPVTIPAGVLEFLAHRIVSNVRELEGALKRVVAYASLVGRPITLDMAQDVLRDLLRCNDRKITIEEIQRRVAEYYNVRLADMLSARRARAVARPRQVAMYLSKHLTTRSLPEIGRKFGGRDHTTVIHAVRKIDELCQVDSGIEEDVDLLRRMLEGGGGSS